MSKIYLDYAAATPVDDGVLKAMMPFFSETFHNPSANYESARIAKKALEDARHKVAVELGARSSEIIFTAGGTESANLAIYGVMQAHTDGELIVSAIEHDAVLKPAQKFNPKMLPVDRNGIIKIPEILKIINEKTVLISVMLANNEIGTIQPIKEVTLIVQEVLKQRKKSGNKMPLYVHTDACQAPLYLDLNVARLGVDMMTLNGGKMYGPKQSGVLYRKANVVINPLIFGGGQEWGMRSGTENVAFAVGFAYALEKAGRGRTARAKKTVELRDYFIQELENIGAEITGSKPHRLANNIHVIFKGIDNERVLFALDDMGIEAAAGSACSASSEEASHVLIAIGKTTEEARSSIRFSLGKSTTKEEINTVIEKLKIALHA